jgi:CheY-like chemotaxis protein
VVAVVRALAQNLRGASGIECPDGEDPTFWARLPFGRDPQELWRGNPGARRVLVVEDDEVNQQVLRVMLRRMGLEVTLTPNGHKAVALARGGGFGLILMDLHLPGMNGLDAARAIRREEPLDRRSVIIATTACVFEEDRRECLLAGMDDFLSKPFTGRDLQEVICQWIDLDQHF